LSLNNVVKLIDLGLQLQDILLLFVYFTIFAFNHQTDHLGLGIKLDLVFSEFDLLLPEDSIELIAFHLFLVFSVVENLKLSDEYDTEDLHDALQCEAELHSVAGYLVQDKLSCLVYEIYLFDHMLVHRDVQKTLLYFQIHQSL
jgi:hypothetical protein